ncbi:MAG: ABC transporter ATP-binding protein [Desulfatibacillaceae bacterium]
MIELAGLSKRYGKVMAVNGLDLSVGSGEIFGFIGPNGAGKTTTIRMMGGLVAPTAGTVRINGIDMAKRPEEAKRHIGFIPDRPFLYDKLTGTEFLRFTADLYRVPPELFPERSEKLLRMFSLWQWADELIESYSHGMKQRLIMCAAFLHDPAVIIVDEPMVGLDPRGIRLVKDILREQSEKGVTVFLSTHTLQVAQDLCHRIAVISRGNIIAQGSTSDLRTRSGASEEDLEAVFLRLTEEESEPSAP